MRIWRDAMVADPVGYRPLTLDLTRPANAAGPCPVVVWIHGGAWLFGSNKESGTILDQAGVPALVAGAGWALARVSYRFSGEAGFPAQLHDVKAAVRWLRYFAVDLGLDAARIAVWGESAGGHLASLLALTGDDPALAGDLGVTGVSDAVAAAVVWYGPSDLGAMQAQTVLPGARGHEAADSPESRLIGGPLAEHPERAAQASPLTYASAGGPPMLLIHGTDDHLVPMAQSTTLFERLTGLGAPVELDVVEGADHLFGGVDPAPLARRSMGFLERALSR